MAEQLTIFDIWETVVREPLPRPEPRPEPDLPAPIPVLPGQQSLLSGVHLGEAEVDRALAAFDADRLRAASARTRAQYPQYTPAALWPRWAEGLEHLRAGPPRARLEAAWALAGPDVAEAHFPGISGERFGALYVDALLAASEAVLGAEGPMARAADGTPLVSLLVRWDRADRALVHLDADAAAVAASGECLRIRARCEGVLGRPADTVLRTWLAAAALEPGATADDPALPAELGDLLAWAEDAGLEGEPGDWLPALADLFGVCPLPAPEAVFAGQDVPADRPGLRFARGLAHLRALRRRRVSDAESRPVKAGLLAAAPGLKERLRGV